MQVLSCFFLLVEVERYIHEDRCGQMPAPVSLWCHLSPVFCRSSAPQMVVDIMRKLPKQSLAGALRDDRVVAEFNFQPVLPSAERNALLVESDINAFCILK